jgi:hypothetical protein
MLGIDTAQMAGLTRHFQQRVPAARSGDGVGGADLLSARFTAGRTLRRDAPFHDELGGWRRPHTSSALPGGAAALRAAGYANGRASSASSAAASDDDADAASSLDTSSEAHVSDSAADAVLSPRTLSRLQSISAGRAVVGTPAVLWCNTLSSGATQGVADAVVASPRQGRAATAEPPGGAHLARPALLGGPKRSPRGGGLHWFDTYIHQLNTAGVGRAAARAHDGRSAGPSRLIATSDLGRLRDAVGEAQRRQQASRW